MIILKSRVSATFTTSLEVEVEVFSEEVLTGKRRLTSRAYLTFVSIDASGRPQRVAPLMVESPEDEARREAAARRRAARLAARAPRQQ